MPFDPELSFVLFKNDVGDNPKRPAYKGSCQVGGVEYEIAGWIRDGKKGKFISGKLTPKKPRGAPAEEKPAQPAQEFRKDDPDDDVPF